MQLVELDTFAGCVSYRHTRRNGTLGGSASAPQMALGAHRCLLVPAAPHVVLQTMLQALLEAVLQAVLPVVLQAVLQAMPAPTVCAPPAGAQQSTDGQRLPLPMDTRLQHRFRRRSRRHYMIR